MTGCFIKLGRRSNGEISDCEANQMFRLRGEIFNNRCRWDLRLEEGLEFDEFDNSETLYMLVQSEHERHVVGCWRLIPTTQPTMVSTTFSPLLPRNYTVASQRTWELSRFAISKSFAARTAFTMSEISRQMFSKLYDFASENQIEQFVTVVSPGMHKLLLRSSLNAPALKPAIAASELNFDNALACTIEVDRKFRDYVKNV